MNMTIKQRKTCVDEVGNYTDRAEYISDLALSSMWGDNVDAEIPADRIEMLGAIWDAAHRSVKEISAAAGMSNLSLAKRFSIPRRTMENWCANVRQCPLYIRLMMQEILGLLKLG